MCPTIVNNVETLCNVKHIVEMGGEAYAKTGRPNNTGTRLLCVSGDVVRPGYYEFPVGELTLGQLINDVCGGIRNGNRLKAVIPGGSSAKVLKAGEVYKIKEKGLDGKMLEKEVGLEDLRLDFDTLAAAGSMAGSGGVIVMDHTRDMVECLANISAFYAHESCGQCTPCREGVLWLKKILGRIAEGHGREDDPALLKEVADRIAGRTICAFGEAAAWPVQSFISKFKAEFSARIARNGSASRHDTISLLH
jgi:NADH-quinone oxidoreductase subunit F